MAAPNTNRVTQIPRAATIQVTDFDSLAQLFSSWEGSFEQLSCGRFESTLQVAHGAQFHSHLATANQAIRVRGRERAGAYTLTLVLPESTGCVWQGKHLGRGRLVVRSGDVGIDHITSKRAINLSMTVGEETLRQAAQAVVRTEPKSLSWLAAHPAPELFGRLELRLRQFILDAGRLSISGLLEAHQLEQACLSAAVEAIVPVTGNRRIDLPPQARTTLVRRAEELMRGRMRAPLGEIDLCETLGVSGRTLRLAFRERFNLGPMAYYQTLRLNAARTALKVTDPESESVAAIARHLGFHHAGKFSGYYRRLFGEVPTKTVLLAHRHRPVPVAG